MTKPPIDETAREDFYHVLIKLAGDYESKHSNVLFRKNRESILDAAKEVVEYAGVSNEILEENVEIFKLQNTIDKTKLARTGVATGTLIAICISLGALLVASMEKDLIKTIIAALILSITAFFIWIGFKIDRYANIWTTAEAIAKIAKTRIDPSIAVKPLQSEEAATHRLENENKKHNFILIITIFSLIVLFSLIINYKS